MARVPNEYRIILVVIFLIAVPSAVLSYISIFALGRKGRELEKKLASSYEAVLDRAVEQTHRELLSQEESVEAVSRQLRQKSYALHTAWDIFSGDVDKPGSLFCGVAVFDRMGNPRFPKLRPDIPRERHLPGPVEPEVLVHLQSRLHECESLEFSGSDTAEAQRRYARLAEEAGQRAGGPAARVAAAALLGLARCYRKSGAPQRALEALDTLVYRYPDQTGIAGMPLGPGALLEKARIHEEAGNEEARRKELGSLCMLLARNEVSMAPKYFRFFQDRLFETGGDWVENQFTALSRRVRAYTSFVEAFGPLVRRTVRTIPSKTAGHLRSGDRLAFFTILEAVPEGPARKGMVLFEVDLGRVADRFRAAAAAQGIGDRVTLAVSEGEGPSRGGEQGALVKRPFPRPLGGWEVRLHAGDSPGLDTLTTMRWSLFFWIILIASAVLIGGILFVLRMTSREMRLARDRSTFLSNVTHDLKTPLTSIRMFIDTLRMGRIQDEKETRECLEVMANETGRLTRLIDRVLDFSKAERGTKMYDFREVDVGTVIDRASAIFRKQMTEDGWELKAQVAEDLSSVRADPDAVIEVLLNLLDNAYKYSEEEKKIIVRAGSADGRVSIAVLDRGIGIAKKDQDRIFDPFFRSDDSLSRDVDGTGLGLAHSRHVMRAHGGDIMVESEPGRGSIFTISLPLWKG
jgi:signal transduction histidine kinase